MRKIYFTILAMFCATITFAQNIDFNNNGGDQLWSNPMNWNPSATPTATSIVRLPLIIESLVNSDFTIQKIQTTFATSGSNPGGTVNVSGASILTIDAAANAVFGIENLSNNDAILNFNGNVTINNSTSTGISNTLMRNGNGGSNGIVFADGSILTLMTPLEARSGSNNNFSFNGSLAGTAALRFNANTTSTFGSTSNNTGHEGDLVWIGLNASVVVNTTDNNVFLPVDRKIQVNAINGSIEVNGVNVFQGNVSINGSNSFTFNVDANQNSMGTITFAGASADGTLNLDVDNSITELVFADNSAIDWGSGTLNIIGYQEGVLRFGTNNSGLTTGQLAQITVDGSGGAVALNSDGYLVNQSSLSIDDFDADSAKAIAYPTLVDSKLFFSKIQNNVKIVDLNGKVLFSSKAENQSDVSVSFLKSGIYLLVFDNKKVEKFIKK